MSAVKCGGEDMMGFEGIKKKHANIINIILMDKTCLCKK